MSWVLAAFYVSSVPILLPLLGVHDELGNMLGILPTKKEKLKSRSSSVKQKTVEKMTGLSSVWTNDD